MTASVEPKPPEPGQVHPIEAMLRQVTTDRDSLASGTAIGSFVLRRVLERDDFSVLYLAHASASGMELGIEEYAPVALATRDEDGNLHARSAAQAPALAAGLQAFLNESEQLARLSHPALVRVGPVWQTRGTAFRLRLDLPGRTLVQLRGALGAPPDEAWLRGLLDPLLAGLAHIHEVGLVHGNVRPGRIVVQADGAPLLLDFDAPRKAVALLAPWLASPPEPEFQSPEMHDTNRRAECGPPSDLYSLAAVLQFCIAGRPPLAALQRLEGRQAPSVRELIAESRRVHVNALFGDSFIASIDRAFSLDPAERPQSVAEFREDLRSRVRPANFFTPAPRVEAAAVRARVEPARPGPQALDDSAPAEVPGLEHAPRAVFPAPGPGPVQRRAQARSSSRAEAAALRASAAVGVGEWMRRPRDEANAESLLAKQGLASFRAAKKRAAAQRQALADAAPPAQAQRQTLADAAAPAEASDARAATPAQDEAGASLWPSSMPPQRESEQREPQWIAAPLHAQAREPRLTDEPVFDDDPGEPQLAPRRASGAVVPWVAPARERAHWPWVAGGMLFGAVLAVAIAWGMRDVADDARLAWAALDLPASVRDTGGADASAPPAPTQSDADAGRTTPGAADADRAAAATAAVERPPAQTRTEVTATPLPPAPLAAAAETTVPGATTDTTAQSPAGVQATAPPAAVGPTSAAQAAMQAAAAAPAAAAVAAAPAQTAQTAQATPAGPSTQPAATVPPVPPVPTASAAGTTAAPPAAAVARAEPVAPNAGSTARATPATAVGAASPPPRAPGAAAARNAALGTAPARAVAAPRAMPREPAVAQRAAEPPPSLTPAGACAPRSNFALYQCMKNQCQLDRYYVHAQCVRLRRTDEVS